MKKIYALLAGVMLTAASTTATAGGILTNTNQSIDFLRNPARDAAIGLDGVYSNPAGVAFLPEGFYLGINWQYAAQRPSKVLPMHHSSHLSRLPTIKVIGAFSSTSQYLVVVAHVSLPMVWDHSRV